MSIQELRDRGGRRRPVRRQLVRMPATPAVRTVRNPIPEDQVSRDTAPQDTAPQDTAPKPSAAGPSSPAQRGRLAIVLCVVLGLLLAGALAATVAMGRRWYDHRQLDAAQQAALAAAKQTTVDFVSISAATVDRDLQRIAAGATGEFKDEFTRGLSQVRSAVVENNVESRGEVLRAGVVSGDRDSALVLVAIDATVKNKGAPEGRLSHYRIQVDVALDRASGKWLVSRLQFVG